MLNQRLADLLDLGLQAKQAPWNVKGTNFIDLHELFDKVGRLRDQAADIHLTGFTPVCEIQL